MDDNLIDIITEIHEKFDKKGYIFWYDIRNDIFICYFLVIIHYYLW
jgi:hypothetical protein